MTLNPYSADTTRNWEFAQANNFPRTSEYCPAVQAGPYIVASCKLRLCYAEIVTDFPDEFHSELCRSLGHICNVATFLGFFINGGKREFRHGVYISLGHDFFGKLGPDLHFSIYE